jgi:DNA polymerase-3 subunit epsilon
LRIVAAGLADEWSGDANLEDITLVGIDTETTGRDTASDRVVEVAAVVFRGGRVVSRHDWLVNPGRPIPKEAFDVHGIGDEEVRDKPSFSEILPELVEVLRQGLPVAYNAEFDRDFLVAECTRASAELSDSPPALRKSVVWVDPLVWARELHREAKSKALGEMCERLGIKLEKAHRAVHDAEATLELLSAFRADNRVPRTYAAFVQEQRRLARLFDEERMRWRSRTN